jgi:hypothetical protein
MESLQAAGRKARRFSLVDVERNRRFKFLAWLEDLKTSFAAFRGESNRVRDARIRFQTNRLPMGRRVNDALCKRTVKCLR